MDHTARDPHDLPDDADVGDLAAYVGEDVGRQIVVRLTLGVIALALLAGAFSEAADAVRVAAIAVSSVGLLLVVVAGLARWSRGRQWCVLALVLATTTPLVVVMLAQHRSA